MANTVKINVDIPTITKDEMDALGETIDLTRSQMVREALERTLPLWRERSVERQQVREQAIAVPAEV